MKRRLTLIDFCRMEEDLNHCKSEIADLNSQIAHERLVVATTIVVSVIDLRAIAEERQETIQDLHGVQVHYDAYI